MSGRVHEYAAHLVWEGNTGEGTARYDGYERRWRVEAAGKPALVGSAHASFRGDGHLHDPEDLLLASASACHMLAYLALCGREGLRVVAYEDQARGTLELDAGGGGRFASIRLAPTVTVDAEADVTRARDLHAAAHKRCFIAASCRVPIRVEANVQRAEATPSHDGSLDRTTHEAAPADPKALRDLTLSLEQRPGELARVGEALGRAGVSIEGGGAWVVDGRGIAHFLVSDAPSARAALEAEGIAVVAEREVLLQRLDQAKPGQLGALTRRMAQAGVDIEVLYSDHAHRLVLVVDDFEQGRAVSAAWMRAAGSVSAGT